MKHVHIFISAFLLASILSGCALKQEQTRFSQPETAEVNQNETEIALNLEVKDAASGEAAPENGEAFTAVSSRTVLRPDWSTCFGELNGTAVIFDPEENVFQIYNEDLADARRSPCSTFKIISSLVGIECRAINPESSFRPWSGEIFWNDDWNQDMDFYSAFRTSCVWYYRQVIDDIGPDTILEALETLQYGNCDISDWEGHLNNNNSNPALTGFWIESSLKISPKEQAQVMERIFGETSEYSLDTQAILAEAMSLPEASDEACKIYGKTGMGKDSNVVVDCWYTGFADAGHRIYFCIYLGETANQNVSSKRAREIAVSLIKNNYS